MNWRVVTLLVCLYGIVKEFRPATPFLTPFLVSDFKNLTVDVVYRDIYPFWTYSYLFSLIPIFILTDLLRYNPIIILEAGSLTLTWLLLVFGQGVFQMQCMQISFGVASAAEIAFSSYLYAVVGQTHYRKVTSYIRTSILIGKLFAFGLAQILISYDLGSYLLLNQISLGAVSFVTLIALVLPRPPSKVKANVEAEASPALQNVEPTVKPSLKHFKKLVRHFEAYKNPVVLRWSLWYSFTSCTIFQIYNYVQPLWIEIDPSQEKVENGLVECINTILGAAISFGVQFIHIEWATNGEWMLGLSAMCIASVVYLGTLVNHVYMAYLSFIIVVFIYHGCGTVASATIASHISKQNYGFIFGWNTFVALLFQSAITFVLVDRNYFDMTIKEQFAIYSMIFYLVGTIFLLLKLTRPARPRVVNHQVTHDRVVERNC